MQSLRYIAAALALGLISVWGSEMLFWAAPQRDFTLVDWLITWLAYSLCSAVVLSAVRFSGISGMRAVFLGGAMLGFLAEGVIVGTIYEAFPIQLVWTPLAWHALITGVCVFGLGRAAPHWPLWRHGAALAALGAGGAVFALFWPLDPRWATAAPAFGPVLAYLAGIGTGVVAAHMLLDRIAEVPRPPVWVALVVPVLAVALWGAQSFADPRPARLALPVMLGLTFWAMWRLGQRGTPVAFGPPAPPWRHLLFVLAPLTTALIAVPAWQGLGGVPTNIPVFIVTVALSAGWWLWLLGRALRQPRTAASAVARSIAPS